MDHVIYRRFFSVQIMNMDMIILRIVRQPNFSSYHASSLMQKRTSSCLGEAASAGRGTLLTHLSTAPHLTPQRRGPLPSHLPKSAATANSSSGASSGPSSLDPFASSIGPSANWASPPADSSPQCRDASPPSTLICNRHRHLPPPHVMLFPLMT